MSLVPPVSEDLIMKMAQLTTRDTVSLSQFQERYERQTNAFLSQKSHAILKVPDYVKDVAHHIELLSQKGQETLKKLLMVLNKQGGIFSASDVAEGTANVYLYHATAKSIRRDIKYLAIFSRSDAEELKNRYVTVVTELYDKFYGVCNEHLSQELQNRSKGREKVIDVNTLNTTDRTFEYKITMADQTIETLHKLRMDVTLPTALKHQHLPPGSILAELKDCDLKKLNEELECIATKVIEKHELPTQQNQLDIARRIRELRRATWRMDFNAAYDFRSYMNSLLETFAKKICAFAIEHVLKKDLEVSQLVALISRPTLIPASQLLDLQTAANALVDDSKKMLEAITFATLPTRKTGS